MNKDTLSSKLGLIILDTVRNSDSNKEEVIDLIPIIIQNNISDFKLNPELKGEKIDITPCIDEMNKRYHCVSAPHELDNIVTTVWVKKGDFVDQSVVKRILKVIEEDGENK